VPVLRIFFGKPEASSEKNQPGHKGLNISIMNKLGLDFFVV
jgi:hypothetical protein